MKTIVKVTVELEVEHEGRMPENDVKKLAEMDIHHSQTAGASVKYGAYRVREIKRSSEI